MRPPVLHDGFYRSIEAPKAAGLAPVRHGKRVGLVQMVGMVRGVVRSKSRPSSASGGGLSVNVQRAEPVRDLVNVANVFAPNHLSYEPLHAVDRCVAFQSGVDHLLGHHAVKVDQRGQAGVKQAPAFFGHGVFVGSKVGKARHGEFERSLHVAQAGGLGREIDAAWMMPVVLLDHGLNLSVNLVGLIHGRFGCRRIAFPRKAVFSIVAVLAPNGFPVFHHPARLLSDFSIERIHAIRRLLSNAGEKPRTRREPTRMIVFHKAAVFHK